MSSGDMAFTIIVCAALASYTLIRIARIVFKDWDVTL
jgi:hypothetical protein